MPVTIIWSALARKRLQEIQTYIAHDKPDAAARRVTRIVAIVEASRSYPHLGRASAQPGIRELVIGGTPYVVFYRILGARVIISFIWHGAQRREIKD